MVIFIYTKQKQYINQPANQQRHYDWSFSVKFFFHFISKSVLSDWSDSSVLSVLLYALHSLSLSLLELHSSHILSTSLISRTLVTRTVMSSMRNWILQLWPPIPAHEALSTLPGTLSSTQPSSLAHTNACHCRPLPHEGTQTDALLCFFPSVMIFII